MPPEPSSPDTQRPASLFKHCSNFNECCAFIRATVYAPQYRPVRPCAHTLHMGT